MVWDVDRFNAIRISVASPEQILKWSYGEVKKPETINYRTHKPERDGLFCEKIFGPQRDWTCYCGKYKSIRYKGIICERCGVEITKANVRRERMGHIELATPVAHIWYAKGTPSYMALLLDITPRDLEKVLYFNSYIVVDPGTLPLRKKQILSEDEYRYYFERYGDIFRAGMGAETIRELLKEINLNQITAELQAKNNESDGKNPALLKRLDVVKIFKESVSRPEWMILEQLPVIPPDLRPMVQLDGGRFAASDLNDLYRRVINRNNRLRRLMNLGAPEIIIKNEKRMLQEAVNSLIDNGKRGKPVTGPGKRPLKSLNDMLKGKQGRFRQNLLGKRVDYSGRSVIVVGPKLQLHECGLPKKMALELFKPFVMHKLVSSGKAHNIKNAKKMLEKGFEEVWDILEEVICDHPVLLNRAPTLHRFGIQAFQPKLVEGKAIQIHPLVCGAFNADFDGDQMAVHIPLLVEAQTESKTLMLSAHNLFSSANGRPLVAPSQDMAIGCYYLTKFGAGGEIREVEEKKSKNKVIVSLKDQLITGDIPVKSAEDILIPGSKVGRGDSYIIRKNQIFDENTVELLAKHKIDKVKILEKPVFSSRDEAVLAFETGAISLTRRIYYPVDPQNNSYEETTVGRILFNDIVPKEIGFVNKIMDKGELSSLVSTCYRICGRSRTVKFLDDVKELGFRYATKAGVSISIKELVSPPLKRRLIEQADDKSRDVEKLLNDKSISREEKRQRYVDIWMNANEQVTDDMLQAFRSQDERGEFNSIYTMAISGARGNIQQVRQLAAMRGLMSNPRGDIMDFPIKSNFREGLKLTEYFISTYGARKGLVDTALRTADSGYLTRRLVDVAQEVVVTELDCGTKEGVDLYPLREKRTINNHAVEEVIIPLRERILSRVSLEDIVDVNDGSLIVAADEEIDEAIAKRIEKNEKVMAVSDEMKGFVTAEMVLEPRTNKVILRPDRIIDDLAIRQFKEKKVGEVRVRPSYKFRSALTCKSPRGICQKCFGRDLAGNRLVDIGDAAGIIAAQSIGEPGTQLTMRTFHYGGVAALEQKLYIKSKVEGRVDFDNLEWTLRLERGKQSIESEVIEGVDDGGLSKDVRKTVIRGFVEIVSKDNRRERYPMPTGATLKVDEGQTIGVSDIICEYDPNQVVADIGGRIKYENVELKEGIVVTDNAVLFILDEKGEISSHFYNIPQGSSIKVQDGDMVNPGDLLAETAVERKIAIAGFDGRVEFFDIKVKNKRVISDTGLIFIVPTEDGLTASETYELPKGIKERRVDDDSRFGPELKVHSGHEVRHNDELLVLTSEIGGKIIFDGKNDILVKHDERKEYRISSDVPNHIEEIDNKMVISFFPDVAGKVGIILEHGAGGKTPDIRRIVVNEEKTYELPWDAHVTMSDARIRPGDLVKKGDKITGDLSFKTAIDGKVEVTLSKAVTDEGSLVSDEVKNLKKKITVRNIKTLKLDKKSQVCDKLKDRFFAQDVIVEKTGKVVGKKGELITDSWLADNFYISNMDGRIHYQNFKKVDITGSESIEKLKGYTLADDIFDYSTGELIVEGGIVLDGQALAKIRNNRDRIRKVKVESEMIVVKKETEVQINRKEPFKDRLFEREVMQDVVDAKTGQIICPAGLELNEEHLEIIDKQRMSLKKIFIASKKEYEIKPGMTPKIKEGVEIEAGTELVSPTHLKEIVYIDSTEEYEIPPGLTLKVSDGQQVKAQDILTEPIPAIVSEIDGKVNYITEYNKKTGYEIIRKITVHTGKEFLIPAGIPLKVKNGDYIKPTEIKTDDGIRLEYPPLTVPVEFEDIEEEDKFLKIARTERLEKKYRVSKDMEIMVEDGQSIEIGAKLAILKNSKLEILRNYEEKVVVDEYNVFSARYPQMKPGKVQLYKNGKAIDQLDGGYTCLYSLGEVHFAEKPKGNWSIKYIYEAPGVVKLMRSTTKEGRARTSLDSIVVQAGEAHRVSDGAELKVEDTLINLSAKLSIVDKLLGKVALEDLVDASGKIYLKNGERITEEKAKLVDQHKSELIPTIFRAADWVKRGTILARFEAGAKKTVDIVQGLPRVAELFEIRRPKKEATCVENHGIVRLSGNNISIELPDRSVKHLKTRFGTSQLLVDDGEIVHSGDRLTEGNIYPKKLMDIGGMEAIQQYLTDEVQHVYRNQGVRIHDKHMEIIIRQMLRKIEISDPGSTDFLPEELVHLKDFEEANIKEIEDKQKGKKDGEVRTASGKRILQGITKAALTTRSFISAASFQETTRVLTKAAVKGQVDILSGLKENLIIGKLIPAGTGLDSFKNLRLSGPVAEEEKEAIADDGAFYVDEAMEEAERAMERSDT